MQNKEEINLAVYGTSDVRLSEKRANRRARQARKFNRKLREIFRKNKGLANRE